MRKRISLAALGSVMLLAAMPGVRAQEAGKVVLGQIGISFYAVTASVVQQVLERLGHEVTVKSGSHAQIFPQLGDGEVDVLIAAWLPHAHAIYWDQYEDNAEALAVLYEGARFYWMVPNYVPESAVAAVDDLRKPEVLARMDKTIRGTGPDSGLMINSAKMMSAYGLEEVGYRLAPGAHTAWIDTWRTGIADGRWFVMPLFRPQFINRLHNMRPIAEPKNLLGDPDEGTLVAAKPWLARAPQRTVQVLSNIRLGLDAVEEMDYMVNVQKMSPRDAARRWMEKNDAVVAGWFARR